MPSRRNKGRIFKSLQRSAIHLGRQLISSIAICALRGQVRLARALQQPLRIRPCDALTRLAFQCEQVLPDHAWHRFAGVTRQPVLQPAGGLRQGPS
jgi:hypothetical protein